MGHDPIKNSIVVDATRQEQARNLNWSADISPESRGFKREPQVAVTMVKRTNISTTINANNDSSCMKPNKIVQSNRDGETIITEGINKEGRWNPFWRPIHDFQDSLAPTRSHRKE